MKTSRRPYGIQSRFSKLKNTIFHSQSEWKTVAKYSTKTERNNKLKHLKPRTIRKIKEEFQKKDLQ